MEYLKILHKQGNLDKLLQTAEELHLTHTYDSAILEWICKIYNESKIESTLLYKKIEPKIGEYNDRLLDIHPDSSMGLFTLAVRKSEQTLFDAIELLQKGIVLFMLLVVVFFKTNVLVVALRPGLLHAWVLLTKCYSEMQLFNEALVSAGKADKLLNSINNSNSALRSILDKLRLEILSRSHNKEQLSEAIQIGEKVSALFWLSYLD